MESSGRDSWLDIVAAAAVLQVGFWDKYPGEKDANSLGWLAGQKAGEHIIQPLKCTPVSSTAIIPGLLLRV